MDPVDASTEGHWLAGLDRHLLGQLVSSRTLRIALASDLHYAAPPTLSEGAVRAVLGEDAVRVALRVVDGASLVGECSRCLSPFGACVHVAVLASDLAWSAPFREALLSGASTREASERAPRLRQAQNLGIGFEGALAAWLAPSATGTPVEIAASPFTAPESVGRAYGDRDLAPKKSLTIVVRRAGERKLLAPRDLASPVTFAAADRRVLEYARDPGSGRKAASVSGVEASLAIEAMRAHGGIFADGFKGLLDFRDATVRPTISLAAAGTSDALPFDALSALWLPDNGAKPIAFAESLLFAGPFPYVWTKRGVIYRVAPDVDLDFALKLAEAPVLMVPEGKLKGAGARLLGAMRGKGIGLPAYEAFGLLPLETPRLVLRLAGDALAVEGDLVAVYRARELSLFSLSGARPTPSGDERDLPCEGRARRHLARAGLVREGGDDEGILEGESRIFISGEDAVQFWQTGLAALRDATNPPLEIELSQQLARVSIGAPVVGRVHVALEGDWLDTRLEFSSKELRVELEAIRQALARKNRWVVLSDGTLSRISASLEALIEEASAIMAGEEARLPAHQLGRLDRWIEENDGRMDAAVDVLRRRLHALAVAAEPDMPEGLVATLRPYQRLGLSWLQFLHALGAGGILADDMGLGKTVTTLAFLLKQKETLGPSPTLVVCPTSVATNWVREAARFTPGLDVLLLHGATRDPGAIAASDLVITTYGLLRRDVDALAAISFRCVVLDEAQNIKNAASATTRAAGRLNARMRLALSGTPVENRLGELWSLASFVNPGILGTVRTFETRFERPIAADRQSPAAAELRAIVRPFLLRRTKNDVLRELPPKTEIDRFVTLTRESKRKYDALAHTLRTSISCKIEDRRGQGSLSVFTALMRLRQMACDPRLVDGRLSPLESAKREAFLDLVRELKSEGRRALVFSQFVELLTLWRQDLDAEKIDYEYLDGQTTKRDLVVSRFQEGDAPLFLISLKAGGSGLNLTAADTVIHCDPWWNPAVEDQATDRAYRIGQDKPVTVVRLVARGTIEEKILSLKAKKRELASAVIGDDARALEGISEDDIRALLGDADEEDLDAQPSENLPTDTLATNKYVVSDDFLLVVRDVKKWLLATGRKESELASLVDIPVAYATRLALGEPFPCSRAVGDRIRARIAAW